ncbi:MAG: carbamoyltransferase HypF [Thermoguttaceae bacterium]
MNRPTLLPERRVAVTVRGVVQGVGFRPFVFNAARRLDLAGWVLNEADTVRIEVAGVGDRVEGFLRTLRLSPPPQARIETIEVVELDRRGPELPGRFEIRASQGNAPPRPTIPADLATCADCLAEIRTVGERRYRYPFTNCTNCGPRWSIIERLPYDRPRTSMAGFPMCDDCRREYEDPTDRRFHAQPIACPACGPHLELLDGGGQVVSRGDEALRGAAAAVLAGRIVALKGLGGFQLLVDATDDDAVRRLRDRKRRYEKPLAVMLAGPGGVAARCAAEPGDLETLGRHEAPILLLRRRPDQAAGGDIAPSVAPNNPYLGVMLPYTPLHHLLVEGIGRPIVCTSGNLSEEPMVTSNDDALERLGSIADLFLVHDRPIVRPVDDSVVHRGPAGSQVLRRARGYAPRPIRLADSGPCVLAVGGHLKNTVALALADQAVLSQHVGDLDNVASIEVHRRAIDDLVEFFQCRPEAVACDLHPDYASTGSAERLADRWKVPLIPVQHHHAHVAACMAEHGLEGPVLGLSWDGTGYGPDGTVWGGEVLRCQGSRFTRAGHLRTFPLPGGERAGREPRCSAAGVLFEVMGQEASQWAKAWFRPLEWTNMLTMLTRRLNAPRTSSMGRLFDAVACICGLAPVISFEGQAAMELEFALDRDETAAYHLADNRQAGVFIADWEPLLRAVLEDRKAGVGVGRISARFHNGLVDWAEQVAAQNGCPEVVLSGGCFQNAALSGRIVERLSDRGLKVYSQEKVPPGDGGIALGQLLVARESLASR